MLISSIVGIAQRATMDLDTTLKNLPLNEETIIRAFDNICGIHSDDGIIYAFDSISPIREDDEYGGYRVMFRANFRKIKAPMSMDISTGDVITPGAELHRFTDIFDENVSYNLWAYTIETVLAEKIETILSRGIDNTRPRDFYDVYILSAYDFDRAIFRVAFTETASHRGSINKITDIAGILANIESDETMNKRWNNYTQQMPYAEGIEFSDTINMIRDMLSRRKDAVCLKPEQ